MISKIVAVAASINIIERTICGWYNFNCRFDFAANRCDPAMGL